MVKPLKVESCECYNGEHFLSFVEKEVQGFLVISTIPRTVTIVGHQDNKIVGRWRLTKTDLDKVINYLQAVKKEWNEQRD